MALPEDEANKDLEVEPGEEQAEVIEVADGEPVAEESEPAVELTTEEALEKALEDVVRFKDAALRAEAEMQNMQRRTARDIENAHKYGIERFLQNLLPVIDGIDKAIEASDQLEGDQADDPIMEGVRLTQKLMLEVVARENVEVIEPLGEPFDPNEHQAMSVVENPDMEPNSVFAVIQKGYKLNDRLVRPAMVMVSKAPDGGEEKVPDAEEDEQESAGET